MYTFPFSLPSNFTSTYNSEMMHYYYPRFADEKTKTVQPARSKLELVQVLTFCYSGHHFPNQKFKQEILLWNKILKLRPLQTSPQRLLGSWTQTAELRNKILKDAVIFF